MADKNGKSAKSLRNQKKCDQYKNGLRRMKSKVAKLKRLIAKGTNRGWPEHCITEFKDAIRRAQLNPHRNVKAA